MACHVTKININKQPNKQNLIALFNKNLKAFETIDGCLYDMPISDKPRFAYAHVWSVCIITRSLHVAFANEYFAFISICRKIRKKEGKKNKTPTKNISILVSIKEP